MNLLCWPVLSALHLFCMRASLQPRKIWAIVHKHLFCLAWHAYAHVHLERKYVRKENTRISIHSAQRGRREKRNREEGFNPQEGIHPWASVSALQHCSLSSEHLSHQFDPEHGKAPMPTWGEHEGDAASATGPVFPTVMNSRKRKQINDYSPCLLSASFLSKGTPSTGNWMCVHNWYDAWVACQQT